MARKELIEGLPENILNLEQNFPIFLLIKTNKIPRDPTTDVSKFAPGFMLHMDFSFFNFESIHEFSSDFVAICSATSYPFGFLSRIKRTPLYILKFIVITLKSRDKTFTFI